MSCSSISTLQGEDLRRVVDARDRFQFELLYGSRSKLVEVDESRADDASVRVC